MVGVQAASVGSGWAAAWVGTDRVAGQASAPAVLVEMDSAVVRALVRVVLVGTGQVADRASAPVDSKADQAVWVRVAVVVVEIESKGHSWVIASLKVKPY